MDFDKLEEMEFDAVELLDPGDGDIGLWLMSFTCSDPPSGPFDVIEIEELEVLEVLELESVELDIVEFDTVELEEPELEEAVPSAGTASLRMYLWT